MVRTLALVMTLGAFLAAGAAQAAVAPDALCKEKKAKAAGKKAADIMKSFGKNIKKPDAANLAEGVSKAQSKFTKAFTKAESKGGCDTTGDAAAIEAKVDAAVADWVTKLTNICGDNARGGIEQCDGTDASECSGLCLPSCICPVPICGNGVKEEGEACDPPCEKGACGDGLICGGFCQCVPDVACSCGSPDPTMYQFTLQPPAQPVCGQSDGIPPLDDLACMGLYIGGGAGGLPVPNMVADEGTTMATRYNVACCHGTDVAITRTTQAEAGTSHCSEGKKCSAGSDNANAACRRDRDCPNGLCEPRCTFVQLLEVFDPNLPPLSTCVQVDVLEDNLGGINCETGQKFLHAPIDIRLHLALTDQSASTPGFQACPICYGGTLDVPGSGLCEGGANKNQPCTPQGTSWEVESCCLGPLLVGKPCSDNSDCPGSSCIPGCTQYPTSTDCPPNPISYYSTVQVPFALTTEQDGKTADAGGSFCGWCRDVEVEGSICFEGDRDEGRTTPDPGDDKLCPDSSVIACRPDAYWGAPPAERDEAEMAECDDPVPCRTDADCTPPYESCEQRVPGIFRDTTARNYSYQGTRAGDLRDHAPHRGAIVDAFCIGPTYAPANDSQGSLPGPAGVAMDADMQLYPSGAFLD